MLSSEFDLFFVVRNGYRSIKMIGKPQRVSFQNFQELDQKIYEMKLRSPVVSLVPGETLCLDAVFAEDTMCGNEIIPAGALFKRYIVSRTTRDRF